MLQETLIIQQTSRPKITAIAEIFATITIWCNFLYLTREFFYIVLQAFGFEIYNHEPITIVNLILELQKYMVWIFSANSALLVWALYNYHRFKNQSRRQQVAIITPRRLAQHYGLSDDTVKEWWTYKNCTIYQDQHGQIENIIPTTLLTNTPNVL